MKVIKFTGDEVIDKIIEDNSYIKYIPNFLSDNESKIYYNSLLKESKWEQGTYVMFGKPIKTPRLLWAMRDKQYQVPESYSVTDSSIYSNEINTLREKIEKVTKRKLLYAQLNYYRDGKDYIGWHTDSEVQKGDIIASISLGVDRKFAIRHKNYKSNKDIPKYEFNLKNGSLLIMDYNTSTKFWKHTLPKMNKINGKRINITFRNK